jgi:hypothetical protein
MTSRYTRVCVNHGGRPRVLLVTDPVREFGALLLTCASASDVTVSIVLPDDHGMLLIAVEAGGAFIGLETEDAVYQYVGDELAAGKCQFVIGGQTTAVDERYVLPVAVAIELATPWLAGAPPLADMEWERQ